MDVKFVANKMLFKVKNNAPTIMVVGGVLGFGVATFLASKATLKVDQILSEQSQQVKIIHEVNENPETAEIYTEQDMNKDLCKVYIMTGLKLAKLYGPAIVTFGVSTYLVTKSHFMMKGRVAALGVTVAGLSAALKRQSQRISELYGEEKADDIWLGTENQKVETTVTNEETGEEKPKKVTAKVVNEDLIVSPYAFVYDESNPNYIHGDPQHNVDDLCNIELWANRKLKAEGYLFLNDIRKACAKKPIPEGQVIGWIYDEKDPNRHNCVDLGISHKMRPDVRDFWSGVSKSFIIDPNVDGVIIDDFFKFDKSNTSF